MCGDCAKYNWAFYGDCPLPDVVPRAKVEEIFEKFKAEMHSRINSCDKLYQEDPDDFYGGQVWAYSAAIFVLENLLKEITDENTR